MYAVVIESPGTSPQGALPMAIESVLQAGVPPERIVVVSPVPPPEDFRTKHKLRHLQSSKQSLVAVAEATADQVPEAWVFCMPDTAVFGHQTAGLLDDMDRQLAHDAGGSETSPLAIKLCDAGSADIGMFNSQWLRSVRPDSNDAAFQACPRPQARFLTRHEDLSVVGTFKYSPDDQDTYRIVHIGVLDLFRFC